ncbi:MAG: hypothetical protein ABJH08_12060 [Balneola sp.]
MRFLSLLLAGLVLSCSENVTSTNPVPELEKEFAINHGEELTFEGTDVSIQFVDVVDNRCNVGDIVCVWSGDATILLDINGHQEELNLYYPDRDHDWQSKPNSIISGYEIKLISLSPERRKTGDEPKNTYTAKLIVNPK